MNSAENISKIDEYVFSNLYQRKIHLLNWGDYPSDLWKCALNVNDFFYFQKFQKIQLNDYQKNVFTLLTQVRSIVGEKAHCMLYLSQGCDVEYIAKKINRTTKTIRNWRKQFLNGGIIGLGVIHHCATPATKQRIVEQELENLLAKSPHDFGLFKKNNKWSCGLISKFFLKTKKIIIKEQTIYRSLILKGWKHNDKIGWHIKKWRAPIEALPASVEMMKKRWQQRLRSRQKNHKFIG